MSKSLSLINVEIGATYTILGKETNYGNYHVLTIRDENGNLYNRHMSNDVLAVKLQKAYVERNLNSYVGMQLKAVIDPQTSVLDWQVL